MSRWPVVTPPKDRSTLHVNVHGALFDGPLNLLIALQGVAQGAVEIDKTRIAYDEIADAAPSGLPVGVKRID